MARFIFKLGFPLLLTTLLAGNIAASADTSGTSRTGAARTSSDLSREFSIVPAGDALYAHLATVRAAGWSTLAASNSAPMTRYEMALETAKALINVRAHRHADPDWLASAPIPALQSLRALCDGLQSELARFDVNSRNMMSELDGWLRIATKSAAHPAAPSSASASVSVPASLDVPDTAAALESSRHFGLIGAPRSARGRGDGESVALEIPLSQRLRVYGAVSSLARSANDPLQAERSTAMGSLRLGEEERGSFGSVGAGLALTDWLQLRGNASRRPIASSLSGALGSRISGNAISGNAASTATGSERNLGGGVDVMLSPGIVLSGDVAHFKSQGGLLPGLADFSGIRYAGGLQLTGWQNRVALSANLSRLVPEDSLALSVTAAQLNLGVGLTQQISLKLLYQQLFEAPQPTRGNRVFAGGININF